MMSNFLHVVGDLGGEETKPNGSAQWSDLVKETSVTYGSAHVHHCNSTLETSRVTDRLYEGIPLQTNRSIRDASQAAA